MAAAKQTIKTAFIEALPLAIAIATYGLSYGVLAAQAELGIAVIVLMSILVFSGSVQMVVVAMLTVGASLTSILLTTVLLNLRNLLYGAALAESILPAKKWRWLLAYGVTDEPFVLGIARFKKYGPDPLYFGVITATFYLAWVLSGLMGTLIGNQVDPQKWGLDLAFPLTFIALLLPGLKTNPAIATAFAAAAIGIGLEYLMPGNELTIIAAGVLAPLVGLYVRGRSKDA